MPPAQTHSALPGIALGYLTVFVPLIGIIYGIVLATSPDESADPRDREARRHGPWIVLLSLLVGAVYAAVLL